MKLLIFIHSLSSGGAERVTVNLANYWAGKGWEITIATLAGRDKDYFPLHTSVRRIALNLDADSMHPMAALKHNYQRIKSLRDMLKQHQPDIALGIMTTANILLALAATGLDVPVIGSERIHPPMYPLGRAWEWLRRLSYRRLATVVALTHESAAWLDQWTSARRVLVVPNAVTYPITVHPPVIAPLSIMRNTYNLMAVGRLVRQKGFDRLLQVFAILAPRFPDWNLIILGEGECRHSLERLRRTLDLEQRVFFPGPVGNLADWYKATDLFVMSSLFEGFPNTLVEAMSYGVPPVSVDCDTGPRDIIRHEVDGLLVPQNNKEAMVEALATLMRDKELRRQYGQRAVEVRKRFSMEKIVEMWENIFTELSKKNDIETTLIKV